LTIGTPFTFELITEVLKVKSMLNVEFDQAIFYVKANERLEYL